MRKAITVILVVVVVLGGLAIASRMRARKAPPPTTQENWLKNGIPVKTSVITIGDMEQVVEVTGDINALDSVTLSAKIPGRVSAISAREGDSISKGMTVVTLDQADALSNLQNAQGGLETALARLSQAKTNAKVTRIQTDTAIEQAVSSLDAAKARFAVVKNPARSQERMVAENRVASAQANLENAEANFKRNQKLLKQGAISESTFDVAKAQYTVAQADYNSAKEQLSLIKEGGRSEDVAAAQSQVDVAREQLRSARANASQNLLRQEDVKSALAVVAQAQAAVALAKQQVSYTYVKSPISGELASRTTEPGQVVAAGQPLAQVVNLGSVYFKGDVSERELDSVSKGQSVRVRIDAVPGTQFEGTVSEIFPSGSTQSRNFPVRITIRQTGHDVKPGMFARGEIVTGISSNVLLIPKDSVYESKGTQMVFTLGPKNIVKRHIVTVVRENRHDVEIQTPTTLKAGDVVITQGRQNLQDGVKVLVENGK
ncbi:MAG: efflux RND transporter periplasmic adaptor subunit [Armatimonadetes bacterium]|nr:efflux RND transporter periplasmic adaptor subunit [Armatimonadota bacterium]